MRLHAICDYRTTSYTMYSDMQISMVDMHAVTTTTLSLQMAAFVLRHPDPSIHPSIHQQAPWPGQMETCVAQLHLTPPSSEWLLPCPGGTGSSSHTDDRNLHARFSQVSTTLVSRPRPSISHNSVCHAQYSIAAFPCYSLHPYIDEQLQLQLC